MSIYILSIHIGHASPKDTYIIKNSKLQVLKNKSSKDIPIQGKVINENDVPLPGVNIAVKGTTIATVTDLSGNYMLTVPDENAILVFSFIGYTSQEIQAKGGEPINVRLTLDSKALSDIVVTALGIKREEKSIGDR